MLHVRVLPEAACDNSNLSVFFNATCCCHFLTMQCGGLLGLQLSCCLCRQAAIIAGAVPALCNALGDGESPPLSLDVITVLHNLVAPDASGGLPSAPA